MRASRDGGRELIAGIYNYCDRWCERCPFTARCLQFRLEHDQARGRTACEQFDVFSAGFWLELGKALQDAVDLVRRFAVDVPGEGREAGSVSEPGQAAPEGRQRAREHPLAIDALTYAGMVDAWCRDLGRNPGEEEAEALLVIRHYHYFIYPKLVRAIDARMNAFSPNDKLARRDADGSAKVALIAIDRSMAAWGILYRRVGEAEDETLDLLLLLDRLRRAVEAVFPDARAFLRPGFDAVREGP